MNIGEIKAFLGNTQQVRGDAPVRPDQALKQQLRESGLQQAASLQRSFELSAFSSQRTFGLKVYNGALNQTLTVNEQRFTYQAKELKEEQKSLFDFEEVARNVLNFVGGAIKSAAANGADQAKLLEMFGQARSGVLKGVELAEKDLAGFMNEEIEEGISRSQDLIEKGIQRLEQELFGTPAEQTEQVAESASYLRAESGELSIRTRDGDEVFISFEDLQQFQFNRLSGLNEGSVQPPEQQPVDEEAVANPVQVEEQQITPQSLVTSEAEDPQQQQQGQQADAEQDDNADAARQTVVESTMSYERKGFSYSVRGELDEAELAAIGQLVGDANEVASDFFRGDVDQAFESALELGFDSSELTGFALQLNRVEQVQVVQAYEQVQRYSEQEQDEQVRTLAARPVADYLDKMLQVIEQSRNRLESGADYEKLMNGLVNQVTGLQMPDLLQAINRFHSFNNSLVANLPE